PSGHPSNSSSLRASNYALIYPESHRSSRAPLESSPAPSSLPTKDYSKPLFVDCSIEYELPNAPKVPKNSEPILMIHPAYRASKGRKECLP
ncbi:Centrosomal and chromosomal factorlike, partial [Caligus rogercresseyi]